MCIIISKPKKITLTKQTLKDCWDNNPDGAGFMYPLKDKVFISKGYMTFKSFWKAARNIPSNLPVVYHFRIKTHGATCKELCHPYPISYDYDELHATDILSDYGVAHNGIFSNLPNVNTESDTTVFICNILSPILKLSKVERLSLIDDTYEDLLNFISGTSRLAIMNKDGEVGLYGGGWIVYKGCKFSSTGYFRSNSNYYRSSIYDYEDETLMKTISAFEVLKGGKILWNYDNREELVENDEEWFVDKSGDLYRKSKYCSYYYKTFAQSKLLKDTEFVGNLKEIEVKDW